MRNNLLFICYHLLILIFISTISVASDDIKTIELCNRSIAVFDTVNAMVFIKYIDGAIVETRQLSYQEYQFLKNLWPDYIWDLGMNLLPCNRFSSEFITSDSNSLISMDSKVKLFVETGSVYKTQKPHELTINDQIITGCAHYSANQSISLQNTTIEPETKIILHAEKSITLKQGCYIKNGASMRIFVTDY